MNVGLNDILAAASHRPATRSANDSDPNPGVAPQPRRRVDCTVMKSETVALIAGTAQSIESQWPATQPAPAKQPLRQAEPMKMGSLGLRLGFWLSGFHEALQERLDKGESVTEREATLLELSRKEFADMRPLVIAMAVQRLLSVLTTEGPDGASMPARDTMERFAHATLRDLSRRACALLDQEGPDAAFALLGGDVSTVEPLAIFQTVFTTALSLAENFASIVGEGDGSLRRTTHALETEIEKI